MMILPAIDIQGGRCVRLYQGDFSTAQQVADDPLQTARSFAAAGAKWIHMVDLDGAKTGAPVNEAIFLQVAEQAGLQVELGGGIRDRATIDRYLERGISRVILGSAALRNPALVREAVQAYGERIAVGIDAKAGMVAAEGWLDTSQVHYLALARQMERIGVKTIIFTDISKDGTLSGPNLAQLEALVQAVACQVVASGGIHTLRDIQQLAAMGLYGAICGKSLYQGTLRLEDAIAAGGAAC